VKIITIFLVSWVVGLAAYVGALALFYRQSISSGDLTAVLFWSILAFAVAFFALYLPALHAMRRWLRGVRPLWPFPLLAVLLGVVPTTAIVFFFSGGDVRSLASAEATLFYSMFGAAGIVVGLGYAFVMTVPPDKALQLTAKPRPPLSLVDWCRTMKALITSIVEICYWMLLWMLVGYLYGHIFGDNNWHIIPVAGAIYGTLAGFIFSFISYFYRKNFNSLSVQTASIIGLVASMCSMVPITILFVIEFWWAVVFGILAGLISGMLVFVSLKTKFYCQSGTADKRMHSDAAEPRR
jgi:hypothetical protein